LKQEIRGNCVEQSTSMLHGARKVSNIFIFNSPYR